MCIRDREQVDHAARPYALFVILLFAAFPLCAADRPNVVMILADDQAYRDFGFMGNDLVHTPNIDRLAAESARYPNGYVPMSVCRPSLATLLTGLYPHQHGIHFNHPPPGLSVMRKTMTAAQYDDRRYAELGNLRCSYDVACDDNVIIEKSNVQIEDRNFRQKTLHEVSIVNREQQTVLEWILLFKAHAMANGYFALDPGADARAGVLMACLLYTSPSPRDRTRSRMPSSA